MTSERSGGLRGLLRIPSAYAAFDRLVGASRARRVFVEEYLRPQAGDRPGNKPRRLDAIFA